ncbi:MAG: metallophosphoesterase family protein [Saprospiraceae bacterium]|nr:metallophosphoesterase family protein [Saprospiraceae bacterium]
MTTKPKFTKVDLARQYRDKWGIDMPTLTLAKLMYKENKLAFSDVEDARTQLRRIEGKNGKGTGVTVTHKAPERPKNPYSLPQSDEREWTPFILKDSFKVGILSDIHVPYHSVSALTAALDHFVKIGIDCLLLNGDTVDFYQLSRFEKDPRKRGFADELESLSELLQSFKDILNCRIVLKYGNHDERYDSFLLRKAPELYGLPDIRLNTLINKRVDGIEIIGDKRIIQANALDIIHGHEFGQGFFSPVNVARGLSLRAKTNAVQGHNHQTSEHTETNLRGEMKTTWSTGCMCELHPEFLPINKWNHGFATVDLDSNGIDFTFKNYRVKNGKTL